LVSTQWTAACTVCARSSQIDANSQVLHQHTSRSHSCPASRISRRHTGAAIGSSYSSLDGVRLLRRKDAENDTTAAPNAARKTSPWPVPASNGGLRSRTERLAAIAGGVDIGSAILVQTLTCPSLDCGSLWPTSKWRKQGVRLKCADRPPLRAVNARGRCDILGRGDIRDRSCMRACARGSTL
jgi:hypothetical protein